MKLKLLGIVVLVVSLLLGTSLCASAATTASVYFDRIADGKTETGYNASKVGLTASMFGGGVLIDRWKIGVEGGKGSSGDAAPKEITLWSLKGGYRVLDAKATKVDVTLSHLNIDIDYAPFNPNVTGQMVGVDFTQYFSKKIFFSSTFQWSANASYDFMGNSISGDKFVRIVRGKFTYLVTDHIGLTLGYSGIAYTVVNTPFGDKKNLGGLTFGMMYKF